MATNEHILFSTEFFGEIVTVRIAIERLIDDRTVIRLFDEVIEAVGQRSHIVFDLAQVYHVSSVTFSRLIQIHRRSKNRGGEVVLCQLKPGVHEAFRTSNLDRLFKIAATLEEALAALRWSLAIDCPIAGCEGDALTHDPSISDRGEELRCRSCGCRFRVAPFQLSSGGEGRVEVMRFEIPTYEQEQIRAELGVIAHLQIVGRLDLFTSEALVDAWRSLPTPRHALLDLRAATELSEPGLRLLEVNVRADTSIDRIVVLVDPDRSDRTRAVLPNVRVTIAHEEAMSVLRDSPGTDLSPALLLVSARILEKKSEQSHSRQAGTPTEGHGPSSTHQR
jgi:anti-sigma B factor antagonist